MLSPILSLDQVTKTYGATIAVDEVSFDVYPAETTAILGPSGCGKSTLLNLIAGIEPADSGAIRWKGTDLAPLPTHRRNFGLMFQDYALFPHLDVAANIAFGLRYREMTEPEKKDRVQELLELVGLAGFGPRSVNTLSGGEQQRVALARSLAPEPQLLMLDEPLGALDRSLRDRLLEDLRRILSELGQTTLYITHDQAEAFEIAGRIVLMRAGRIEQIGTPQEMYGAPVSVFAARFLGLDNIVGGTIQGRTLRTPYGELPLDAEEPPGEVAVLLRPEGGLLSGGGPGLEVTGTVREVNFGGAVSRLVVATPHGDLTFTIAAGQPLPETRDEIRFSIPAEAILIFRP
ncbi:MAG TPA: ABC transporter ATP-binding protein [Anaerolineales bacterium]|nr:ABC transporter ATP-binding protein [Anaerolineales bacterium]